MSFSPSRRAERAKRVTGLFGALLVSLVALMGCSAGALAQSATPPPLGEPGVPSDPDQLSPDPEVDPAEAEAYAQRFEVPYDEAVRRLTVQIRGLAIDAALRAKIWDSFGGLHFDNRVGKLVISVTSEAAREEVEHAAEERGLAKNAFDIRPVDASLPALEERQREIDRTLADDIARSLVGTGLDVAANAVQLRVSSEAPTSTRSRVESEADDKNVLQEVVPPKLLTPSPDYCTYPNCNKPLRGAVEMYLSDFGTPGCSAGFVGYTTTTWVMFTAGHCVAYSDPVWWGYNAYNGHWLRIGRHVGWDYGTPGDSGTVGTFGSPSPCDWCPDVTTPIIAAWTVSETYPIHYRWFPYTGLYLCRLGATTPISCGYVQETNVTRGYSDGTIVSGLFRTDACSAGGDSGGPYVANYIAIGLHSASTGSCSGSSETYGIEILNAETRIGARVHTYY